MERERTSCVFCTRVGQPATLFETAALYAMPDKFPLCPGHILLISKAHLPCYGAADAATACELDEAVVRVEAFLAAHYTSSGALFLWENGVAGQTVPHAHLHLLPLPFGGTPPALDREADAARIDGWAAVRDHFAQRGTYRYVAHAGGRWLLPGQSAAIGRLQDLVARVTGLRHTSAGWLRTTTPEDVDEVARRWAAWSAGGREGDSAGAL